MRKEGPDGRGANQRSQRQQEGKSFSPNLDSVNAKGTIFGSSHFRVPDSSMMTSQCPFFWRHVAFFFRVPLEQEGVGCFCSCS
jgi:hypothetical protein